MKRRPLSYPALALAAVVLLPSLRSADPDLWELARRNAAVHRFSTLFTAHDVRKHLASEAGIDQALAWCKATAVTKVYMENFRDGVDVDPALLRHARDRFREAGFEVSGGITTTSVGRRSNRWNIIACYTDGPTQDRVERMSTVAAGLFDEIMVDDFWFTECSCSQCDEARKARRVTVGGRATEVSGDTWEDYRGELMLRMSVEKLIGPAKKANPRCRVIVKYPQWYDAFHERGYDVVEQTRVFDRIWVGTETRDYSDPQWGGTVQYEAYFIMRWLGGIGGGKCGGGWFDWLGTTERTYLEQARQTVLGGARETTLFCYGGLQGQTGPKNITAFRGEVPALFALATEVGRRTPKGIAAYKPPGSPPGADKRVFDFVGMLGLPLVPCHEFPTNASAAFFSLHAMKDPAFPANLARYLDAGHAVLLTDTLSSALPQDVLAGRRKVGVLPVRGDPKRVMELEPGVLDSLREPLLSALGIRFRAPAKVQLVLFSDGSRVVSNFRDEPVEVELDGGKETVPARGWVQRWR